VFIRLTIQIDRYPTYREHLVAQTWPINISGLYSLREYRLLDEAGEQVAAGTSRWVLLDTEKKRAIRVPPHVEAMMVCGEDRIIDDAFKRLPRLEHAERNTPLDVQFNDIDTNQHVNSAAYLSWCLHAMPHDFLTGHRMRKAEIAYRQEAVLGDKVMVSSAREHASDTARHHLHEVTHAEDERLLVQIRTEWTGA